jgi:hypothetical protein
MLWSQQSLMEKTTEEDFGYKLDMKNKSPIDLLYLWLHIEN